MKYPSLDHETKLIEQQSKIITDVMDDLDVFNEAGTVTIGGRTLIGAEIIAHDIAELSKVLDDELLIQGIEKEREADHE
jgi:hypothetical protein